MQVAEGILTARGGMTSHAAVVARGMGKCCVAGCGELEHRLCRRHDRSANGRVIRRGEFVTLDGSTGEVIAGQVPTVQPEMSAAFQKFMKWADAERRLGVRANADTPNDAEVAREFGAEGIGLCRTEHMFFGAGRIDGGARDDPGRDRRAARARRWRRSLPMQREDFVGILRAMAGLPVTIRLLDPPLHEFLPKDDARDPRARRAPWASTYEHLTAGARQSGGVQPDAGASRIAAGHQLSGNLPGAGARDPRGGGGVARRRCQGDAGDHAAADRRAQGIRLAGGARSARSRDEVAGQQRAQARFHDRHHDRGAARLYRGRPDRRSRRSSFPSAPTT